MITVEIRCSKKGHAFACVCLNGKVISFDKDLICELLGCSKTKLFALYINAKDSVVLISYERSKT